MSLIYQIGILLYGLIIRLAAPFNPKAKAWRDGRKNNPLPDLSTQKVIWFHCASVGEYEQGKPIMAALKKKLADHLLLISFYSPSGYKAFDHYSIIDHICYLPLDNPIKAKRFIKTINPAIAIFVKYEFWFNYLKQLNVKQIPTFVISAKIYPKHILLKPYMQFLRNELQQINAFMVQNQESKELLESVGFSNVHITGDSRIDRVKEIKLEYFDFSKIESLINGRNCLVAGSTWPVDDQLLVDWRKAYPNDFLIIAPHEWDENKINQLTTDFGPQSIKYSELTKAHQLTNTIILDKMGVLKYIYRIAQSAYIGGGFGEGIHNILEAAIYNIKVTFGPRHHKFEEAHQLTNQLIALPVSSKLEFINAYKLNTSKQEQSLTKVRAASYFNQYTDVTTKTIFVIFKHLPSFSAKVQ